jgi:hypothetical protein
MTPTPLGAIGLCTLLHATARVPALTTSVPVHRKAHIIFRKALISHGGMPTPIEVYTGI